MNFLQIIYNYFKNNNNENNNENNNKHNKFKFYKTIIENIDYKNNSWIVNSIFNYIEPDKSIMNLAYPSSIAYYYITIVPPKVNYNITGKFFENNVFEMSVTVYNENGNINEDYKPLTNYNSDNLYYNYNINNKTNSIFYIIIRYYINLDVYSHQDIINNLPYVYNNTDNIIVNRLNDNDREKYSILLTKPYEEIITHISPVINDNFSKFYLPGCTNGLFIDKNHMYLISTPGHYKLFQIKGYFKYSKTIPYIDIITVNQDTTQTDNGLPFYKFCIKSNYYDNIYIADNSIDDETIYNINKDALIIRWNKNNNNKAIIFRMINYKNDEFITNIGPLSPEQTEELMKNGFYPTIIPLDLEI